MSITKNDFIKFFWSNYELLEDKLIETSKFISIDPNNNDAFSHEYLSLFILICNDFDALTTEYCKTLGYENKNHYLNIREKIGKIKNDIKGFEYLRTETITKYSGISIPPYPKFNDESSADWWQDYNNVKHNRCGTVEGAERPNYYKANLKNVLWSLAALYILSVKFYEKLDGESDYILSSKIFTEIK